MEESVFLNPAKTIRAAGIEEGMRVADLGAGSGFFTRAAAREVGPTGSVWAVDAQSSLLARVKNLAHAENLHNVDIIRGDISIIGGSNLPSESFDFVILTNVLFMNDNKIGVIEEVARLLMSEGRALVIDWTDSHGGLGPHPDHVIDQDHARHLCEENNLYFLHEVPAGDYHWGFVVSRKSK